MERVRLSAGERVKEKKMGLHLDPRAKMRIGGIKLERKETERINIRRRTSQKRSKSGEQIGERKRVVESNQARAIIPAPLYLHPLSGYVMLSPSDSSGGGIYHRPVGL